MLQNYCSTVGSMLEPALGVSTYMHIDAPVCESPHSQQCSPLPNHALADPCQREEEQCPAHLGPCLQPLVKRSGLGMCWWGGACSSLPVLLLHAAVLLSWAGGGGEIHVCAGEHFP